MIKILIAIIMLLIVAIVRLAMSCRRKAKDVDYWRKATQDQHQENSEANATIERLERELAQTNAEGYDHHQCQQKIIDKLTQEVDDVKASLKQEDEALRIISAAARGAIEYKDATIVALQSEITILKDRLSHPENPNKDMLATLSDIQLAKLSCERKTTDKISIEPKIEQILPPDTPAAKKELKK